MKVACDTCGSPITFDPEFIVGGQPPRICGQCESASRKRDLSESRHQAMEKRWVRLCPELYRDTVVEKLPAPEKSLSVIKRIDEGRGMNLWGNTGTGKTRTLYLVLKDMHFRGREIMVFRPGEFVQQCEGRAFRRAPWLRMLSRIDVLAFDDVDKIATTKDKETDLFSVLDYRFGNRRPTFFTGNCDGQQLAGKFRYTDGHALVRRIRQSCLSFHFL